MTSEWMTAAEVAEELRIPIATIYDWRYRGSGPAAHKFGRHLRYKRADVARWADEQRVATVR